MYYTIVKFSKKKSIQNKIELVNRCKDRCKTLPQYKKIVKEYKNNHGLDIDVDTIDGVSIRFCDEIDSSARTVNGEICLNEEIISNDSVGKEVAGSSDEDLITRYILHEMVHVFQHMKNEGKKIKKEKEYLNREEEQEAFQAQISFMNDNGEDVSSYVKKVIDLHDVKKDDLKEVTDSLLSGLSKKDKEEVKEKIQE